MAEMLVVKRRTTTAEIVKRSASVLNGGEPIGWTVPKRHDRAANEAAVTLSASVPGFRFSRLHGSPGEYVYLCSTKDPAPGDVFAYWPPSKGATDTYDLVELEDGSLVGVLRDRDV